MLKWITGGRKKKTEEVPVIEEPAAPEYRLPKQVQGDLPHNRSPFAAMDFIRGLMEKTGLSLTELEIVLFIVGQERWVSEKDVANGVRHVSVEYIGRLMKRLVKDRHVDVFAKAEQTPVYYPSYFLLNTIKSDL